MTETVVAKTGELSTGGSGKTPAPPRSGADAHRRILELLEAGPMTWGQIRNELYLDNVLIGGLFRYWIEELESAGLIEKAQPDPGRPAHYQLIDQLEQRREMLLVAEQKRIDRMNDARARSEIYRIVGRRIAEAVCAALWDHRARLRPLLEERDSTDATDPL